MAGKQPTKQPRKNRRWWVRLLFWLMAAGVLGLLLAAGGAWWAYQNRTGLANRILRQTFAAFDAQVGGLQISQQGVDVADVTVRDPSSGEQIATVRGIQWRPEWSKVYAGSIGRFTFSGVKLEATAGQLRSWTEARKSEEPSAAAPGGFRLPPLVLESAELLDVSVNVRGDEATPSLSFRLEHKVEGLDLSNLKRPRLREARLKVADLVVVQPDGERIVMPEFGVTTRLREEDGMLEVGPVVLSGVRAKLSPFLRAWIEKLTAGDAAQPAAAPLELPWLKGVAVTVLDIKDCAVEAMAGALGKDWPLNGGASLSWHLKEFEWRPNQPIKPGEHRLELSSLMLRPDSGGGFLKVDKLDLHLAEGQPGWMLKRCELERPSVEWTQALEDVLIRVASSGSSQSVPGVENSGSGSKSFALSDLSVKNAAISFRPTRLCPLEGRLGLELGLRDLQIGPEGVKSAQPQKLQLTDVSLAWPSATTGKAEPFVSLAAIDLAITPDEWRKSFRIDQLEVRQPLVRLTEQTSPWLRKAEEAATPSADSAPASSVPHEAAMATSSSGPWWQKIHFGALVISEGRLEYASSGTGRVEAGANLEISTEPSAGTDPPLHRLRLTNAHGTVPEIARLPVAGLEAIEVGARLPDLWREHRVESLTVSGGQIEAGDALMSLFSNGGTTAEKASAKPGNEKAAAIQEPAPADKSKPKWKVGTVQISDLGITVPRVAPGLPPLRFDVSMTATDTPLEPDELAAHVARQRVELSNLEIPSPYDPLRTVARLDTIFIDFSIEGLFAERIDKVEIVSPTLFVGEDLFWYIEYARKYAAGGISTAQDAPKLAANDKATALGAATATTGRPKQDGSWSVDALQVHAGKLVLAPKGVPLPGFKQPFPFSFVTRLDDGRFDATLDIPPDTYTLPDLKLEFRGMKGKVEFNLPMKGVSNNLTEVFRADQIRWKDLHMEEAHLSVTYDVNGIYGQFGGAAYEGYVNGAFNIYLDQAFSWDGWIATTGIRSTEITEKLCPAYFLLDGKVDCKVVANGSSQELYQADLAFTNTTPGKFSVAGLNEMIQDYARAGTADVTSQLTRIGLETLRDFEYDNVHGEARFYGREGGGFLRFKGPHGSRNIDVRVLDHRWRDEPKKRTEQNDVVTNEE